MAILFGPAGNSASFYEQGGKHSYEVPAWLKNMGLDAYEYSCGRGANVGEATARAIGKAAQENGIAVSVHAPYYINLASNDEQKRINSIEYMMQSLKVAKWMGGKRVVFHPGATTGMTRQEAMQRAMPVMKQALERQKDEGYDDLILCPETMGKLNQLGNLDEVLELCSLDERMVPTIDFGHLNAAGQGFLNRGEAEYEAIIDRIENAIGKERAGRIHVHFSHIEYTKAGEKRHVTFEDDVWGPFFEPLAKVLVRRDMQPWIVCESKEVMAEDALSMKKMYLAELQAAGK